MPGDQTCHPSFRVLLLGLVVWGRKEVWEVLLESPARGSRPSWVYVGETWGEVEMVPVPAESLCAMGDRTSPYQPCALRELVALSQTLPGGALCCSNRTFFSGSSVSLFLWTGKELQFPVAPLGVWQEGVPRPSWLLSRLSPGALPPGALSAACSPPP